MRNLHHSPESDQILVLHFVAPEEFRVVAEVAQEPPECCLKARHRLSMAQVHRLPISVFPSFNARSPVGVITPPCKSIPATTALFGTPISTFLRTVRLTGAH